jgi:hypothetical protein
MMEWRLKRCLIRQMLAYSVDSRTRRYQPNQSVRTTPLDYDDQFERQLPPEVRAELEISPRSINRPPARIPETEEEIDQAIAWLKSQGYLRSAISAPPPIPVQTPPAPPIPESVSRSPASPPTKQPHTGAFICTALALLGLFLYAKSRTDDPSQQSRSGPTWGQSVQERRAVLAPVEVRRALPALPRALPVTSSVSTVSNAPWQPIRMPDGTIVQVFEPGRVALQRSSALSRAFYWRGVLNW